MEYQILDAKFLSEDINNEINVNNIKYNTIFNSIIEKIHKAILQSCAIDMTSDKRRARVYIDSITQSDIYKITKLLSEMYTISVIKNPGFYEIDIGWSGKDNDKINLLSNIREIITLLDFSIKRNNILNIKFATYAFLLQNPSSDDAVIHTIIQKLRKKNYFVIYFINNNLLNLHIQW